MVKDLLQTLQERSRMNGDESSDCTVNYEPVNVHFQKLAKNVEDVQQRLADLSIDINQLKSRHDNILLSPHQDASSQSGLEKMMTALRNDMNAVAKKCKEIDTTAEEMFKKGHLNATETRMVRTMHAALLEKFRTLWVSLCNTETDYRVRCKARIKRQLEIVGQDMNDEQIEDILSNGTSVPIFAREFADSQSAKMALRDIEDRHRELLLLEDSIRQVNSLFQEIGILVQLQGDKIDRIENNITETLETVESGTTQLKKARRMKKRGLKLKLIIAGVVLGVVAIVLLAIFV